MTLWARRIAIPSFGICLAPALAAQAIERVSVDSSGAQADSYSQDASLSADGRFVAFTSFAHNLVPGIPPSNHSQVYVRDRHAGTTELVSRNPGGEAANADAREASISADGRFVAFSSYASNLVPGVVDPGVSDVFVVDRTAGTIEYVSLSTSGFPSGYYSWAPFLSADGRYVAFNSEAPNLDPNDHNTFPDGFVRDRLLGTTEVVTLTPTGGAPNHACYVDGVSADGQVVVFRSGATNLAPLDTDFRVDVYVRDRTSGTTEWLSSTGAGQLGNGRCWASAISGDGRFVAFSSDSGNLLPSDGNFMRDVFLRDRQTGALELVSVTSGEAAGDDYSDDPWLSGDGRFVTFSSIAGNLVAGDTNATRDVFLRDRLHGTTVRSGLGSGGAQGDNASLLGTISADGRWVAFQGYATNLVPGDTNGWADIFVRDVDATTFASLCDPGAGGVAACPCSNPPAGGSRGCDNSSSTGGANLSASGRASLATDTLVFATSGEKPTSLSIVLQGWSFLGNGVVYGQGIRCVGGSLKRLYVKTASGGSITAPETGDVPVSAQSAAKGDTILAGQSRWYLVYYRDPIVPGGCEAASTFNSTQTGQVLWLP